jgi:hypothetical protein
MTNVGFDAAPEVDMLASGIPAASSAPTEAATTALLKRRFITYSLNFVDNSQSHHSFTELLS